MEQRLYTVNSSRLRACRRFIASVRMVIWSVWSARVVRDLPLDHVPIGRASGRALAESGAFMVVIAS
jgi:hypothetical protein